MNDPLVVWLMPAYKSGQTIARALDSIFAQTYTNYYVVIICEPDDLNTIDVVSNYANHDERIRVIQNIHKMGVGYSLNQGIDYTFRTFTECKYFARMDADDYSYPERLKKQVEYLEARPDVGVLGTARRVVEGDRSFIQRLPCFDDEIRVSQLFRVPFIHPSILFRTELLKGGIRYPITLCEDQEFFYLLSKKTKFSNLSDVLIDYYISESQETSSKIGEIRLLNGLNAKRIIRLELDVDIDNFLHLNWIDTYCRPYNVIQYLTNVALTFQRIENSNSSKKIYNEEYLRGELIAQWNIQKEFVHLSFISIDYRKGIWL